MKKILLLFTIILLGNTFINATNLGVGDLAITSYNSDGDDDFSFVLLTAISGTTTVYFTDNGWDDDADGGFANPTWRGTTEGTITWTFTGSLPCGTEIQIFTPATTVSTSHGSATNTGSFNISGTADHLLAYTGTGVPFDGTEITNFIWAFSSGTAGWTSNASTTTTSAIPPGLTDSITAIAMKSSDDNFQYRCTFLSPASSIRAALALDTNFIASATITYLAPGCSYSCSSACNDPDVPTVTHNPTTICNGSTTTLTITGNLNDASKWYIYTGSCGGTLVDSTANSTYVVAPTGPSTTYFIRGEGNCVTPAICGQVTVNVLPAKTGSVTSTICNEDTVIVNSTVYYSGHTSGTEVFTNVGPNNCDSTVTVNLTVLAAKTGLVDDSLCTDGFIIVNGTTYNSSNSFGTEVFTNVGPSSCDSTVNVNLSFYPSLTGSVNDIICNGDSLVINGTVYNASNTSGTEIFTNIGPYSCDSTVTVNITVLPAINNTVTNAAPTLTANQTGANYRWLDCSNSFAVIPGETGQAFTATSTGSYAVEITLGNCVDTSACESVMTTTINESSILAGVNVYPNPANDVINVSLGDITTAVNFTLTSIDGKVVYSLANVNDTKVAIDISNNSKGVYFLKIETNTQQQIFKVIKQ